MCTCAFMNVCNMINVLILLIKFAKLILYNIDYEQSDTVDIYDILKEIIQLINTEEMTYVINDKDITVGKIILYIRHYWWVSNNDKLIH